MLAKLDAGNMAREELESEYIRLFYLDESYRVMLNAKAKEIDRLLRDLARYEYELEEAEASRDAHETMHHWHSNALRTQREESTRLRDENAALKKESQELHDKYGKLWDENAKNADRIASLQGEVSRLYAENAAWAQKHFDEMQEKDRDSLALRSRIERMEKDHIEEIVHKHAAISKQETTCELCPVCSAQALYIEALNEVLATEREIADEAAKEHDVLSDECAMLTTQKTTLLATNNEISALNMALIQTSGELCPVCGWRFVVPGDGCCKCQFAVYKANNYDPAESIRLNAEVMALRADKAALLARPLGNDG